MVHIPFALGGIGVFYSLQGVSESVKLPACVLAKIFKRSITLWDDDAIVAANPGVTLPTRAIKVVHRVEGSSSTTGFTEYLKEVCPAEWTESGSTITWVDNTYEAQGSGGMSSFITENDGAIGYIDAGHGHEHNLKEAQLKNKNDEWLTTLSENCIANAGAVAVSGDFFPTDPTASFADVKLYNLAGTNVWPITMVSYFYINKELSTMDAETAALLYAFVEMVLSAEGQALAEKNLFVKLPPELVTYNAKTLATLVLPAAIEKFGFETAATTQKEIGAGLKMISGKRQSYSDWKNMRQDTDITALQKQIATLQTQIAALQAPQLAAMQTQIAVLQTAVANIDDDDDDIDKTSLGVAATALIFGVAGLALGLMAFMTARSASVATNMKRRNSAPRGQPMITSMNPGNDKL